MLKITNLHKTFNAGTINAKKALDGLSLLALVLYLKRLDTPTLAPPSHGEILEIQGDVLILAVGEMVEGPLGLGGHREGDQGNHTTSQLLHVTTGIQA